MMYRKNIINVLCQFKILLIIKMKNKIIKILMYKTKISKTTFKIKINKNKILKNYKYQKIFKIFRILIL